MTIEQDWARERNGVKKSILGMSTKCKSICNLHTFTDYEKDCIKTAERHFEYVLSGWTQRNGNSKRRYLREVSK